ncbi:NAD(P)-binding protein [Massilia solisilvae]|uniref:NAD(P)-binding protein n=1 Tax=Massilia solisilvae TaxID=1811225 RepID=A0ABT2BH45_9BURK|nr:NAD(P)-binding protein [Massilia solisilvae]MCS0607762.1 NAD(P)-binding protein [Massilia solisilvae]
MAQVQKIAILGGGAGALAAAFYLSGQAGWRERYDITIYQQGWRLGGKGASGRNPDLAQRIEEHGLHIWFGHYANAFALMRAAYAELARPADAPLASWAEAFHPQDYIALAEQAGAGWQFWNLVLPRRPGEPGTGSDPVTPWALALEAIRALRHWHDSLRTLAPGGVEDAAFDTLLSLAHGMPRHPRDHTTHDRAALGRALERVRGHIDGLHVLSIDGGQVQRLLVALNIGATVLKGMLADGVFVRGFNAINDEDLRAWLTRHGGDARLCVDSTPIRALYELLFAYEDGDPARPNLEAGTALRWMLRMAFAYRGSVMYRMTAGMGDAVFAPLYEVLARRGVRFAFFHRVEELVPDDDGVGEIVLTEQAKLRAGRYDPLVDVKGLPCWPDAPLWGQLDAGQAALMQEYGVDLESYFSDWPRIYRQAYGGPLLQRVLRRGRDFDHVVCGIPVGSLPLVAPRLLAKSPALRAAANRLRTIATQACQVWLDRSLADLGWTTQPNGQQPVLTGFSQPYDTWAPMDQVLAREDWPGGAAPASVSYFCGVFPAGELPHQSDSDYPARSNEQARQNAIALLAGRIQGLWPAGFQWQWLHDPLQAQGQARFDRQFWRANVDPSERYVLSVAGSSGYRPVAGGSGLTNLYLAGDWLRTGLDSGCVEAAVMGGMQASRALSGFPAVIEAESDFPEGGGTWATT